MRVTMTHDHRERVSPLSTRRYRAGEAYTLSSDEAMKLVSLGVATYMAPDGSAPLTAEQTATVAAMADQAQAQAVLAEATAEDQIRAELAAQSDVDLRGSAKDAGVRVKGRATDAIEDRDAVIEAIIAALIAEAETDETSEPGEPDGEGAAPDAAA